MNKSADAFRTIGEVAEELDVPKHVLRFWEGKFPQIKPMKRGGGRRYYRPEDMALLRGIRHLLHAEGYTIKGVQKILREQGIEQVKALVRASMAHPRSASKRAAGRGAKREAGAVAKGERSARAEPAAAAAAPAKTREVITAAIRELELCRSLLSGASGAGAPAAKSARAAGGHS